MLRRNAALVGLTLILASGAAACSSRTPPGELRRGGVARVELPGIDGRTCQFASRDSELPAFSRLARLGTRGNVALWGLDLTPADSVVLSVRYDDQGRLAWVRAIEASLDPTRVVTLERLLMESLNEDGPIDWGVRVHVVGGDVAGVEPSVICPPEPRKGLRQRVIPLVTSARDLAALEHARGRRYPIQIFLDHDGRITGVRLPRPSGDTVVDQFLMDWVFGTDFEPKLHDGIRLAAVVEDEIYIPIRRR